MVKSSRKNLSSAPKIFPTPEIFWSRFSEYRQQVKSNPYKVQDYVGKDGKDVDRKKERCLTMEGFENFLEDSYGIGAIQQYLENRDGRYSDYVSIVSRVRREIRQDQIEGGMAGIYNSNLTARINALSEKTESVIDQNVKLLNVDPL